MGTSGINFPTVIPYLKGMARMRALVSLDTMSIITK
jgi:hypothetical protein